MCVFFIYRCTVGKCILGVIEDDSHRCALNDYSDELAILSNLNINDTVTRPPTPTPNEQAEDADDEGISVSSHWEEMPPPPPPSPLRLCCLSRPSILQSRRYAKRVCLPPTPRKRKPIFRSRKQTLKPRKLFI